MTSPQTHSTNSMPVVGHRSPRFFTPALPTHEESMKQWREGRDDYFSELATKVSYGYDVIWFARYVLQQPLDPWQEDLVIRLGEWWPDGTPRFKKALVIVARQNGKTHLCMVLALYWLFVQLADIPDALVIGTSTTVEVAKEPWRKAGDIAQGNVSLKRKLKKVYSGKGAEEILTKAGGRYKIAASNEQGARGMSVDRLIIDELREHRSFKAWDAAEPATRARRGSQVICITNQGDTEAVVLDSLRLPALDHIRNGGGDERLGLFEWSAPPEVPADSVKALQAANPNLGHRIEVEGLLATAKKAMKAGGQELAGFKTETLCIRVELLDPAIDPESWRLCGGNFPSKGAGGWSQALCLDVSPDGDHATLVSAGKVSGVIQCEVVAQWEGFGCLSKVRAEVPGLVARIQPTEFVFLPGGPIRAMTAQLKERRGEKWPPGRTRLREIRAGEVAEACMGLNEQVIAREVMHARDDLLTAHIMAAAKKPMAEGWVFDRRGSQPIDGAYALAGAVHAVRTQIAAVRPAAF